VPMKSSMKQCVLVPRYSGFPSAETDQCEGGETHTGFASVPEYIGGWFWEGPRVLLTVHDHVDVEPEDRR